MKLLYTHNSPYARRIRVAIREADLLDRIEEINVNPIPDNVDRIRQYSAAAKVPVLITDSDIALCETLIISRYLNHISGGALYAESDPNFEQHLALEGVASALMDSLFVRARENRRDPSERSPSVIAQERERAEKLYDVLDGCVASLGQRVHMDTISAGCALGYADGRHPDDGWRDTRPALAQWFANLMQRKTMAETVPAF